MKPGRKPAPAGPLPKGYNVVKYPSGARARKLNRNQLIRASFASMSKGYTAFKRDAAELLARDRAVEAVFEKINRDLDLLWWALIEAGVVDPRDYEK